MVRLTKIPVVALALLATACERAPSAPAPKPRNSHPTQVGEASFYGKEFAGEKTATGERLKLNAMTAASPTLPLGTHVQVVNRKTGQSATVRINDRGPYVDGRVIDLTPRAARHIGIDRSDGVAPVAVKPILANSSSD